MYFLCWKLKTINQIEKKPFNYIKKPPKQPWKSHPISIFKIDNTNKLVIFWLSIFCASDFKPLSAMELARRPHDQIDEAETKKGLDFGLAKVDPQRLFASAFPGQRDSRSSWRKTDGKARGRYNRQKLLSKVEKQKKKVKSSFSWI